MAPLARMARPAPARGVSLIEILIALLLVSLGLLGLVGLQAKAVQTSIDAQDTVRAAALAEELGAAMWLARSPSLPASTLSAWQTEVGNAADRGLPQGQGSVTVTGNEARIELTWVPPRARTGDAARRYVTHVVIP